MRQDHVGPSDLVSSDVLVDVGPPRLQRNRVQRGGAVGGGEDVGHDLIDDLPQVAHQRLILLRRDRLCSAHAQIDAGDAVRAAALPRVEGQPAVRECFPQEMERA